MGKKSSGGVGRGAFLAGIGAAGAAGVAAGAPAPAEALPTALPAASPATARLIAAAEQAPPNFISTDGYHVSNPGSDYMVQVMRDLSYDYVAAIPGTTFRGLQESVINYAGNSKPEWITCVHEEISGAMAHGYAKVAGKPMAIMVHNTVGLQHATMAIYNAWADRVPMLVMLGNYADGALRTGAADWDHSMTDNAAMVRGYIKYDEQPGSLRHYLESMMRAQGLMMTAPMGPVVIVCDNTLQEQPVPNRPQPPMHAYVPASQPAADPAVVRDVAKKLVAAQNPVIVADRSVRSQADVTNLVALAEALQAPVVDRLGRMNFPTNHYLNGSFAMVANADLLLALDVGDLWDVVNQIEDTPARLSSRRIRPDAVVISVDSELLASAGNYQDKQRFFQADVPVAADSPTMLPYLVEAVNSEMSTARRNDNAVREARNRAAFHLKRTTDQAAAAVGWDSTPISTARLSMELWAQIKRLDWALVSFSSFQSGWPNRLWDFTQYHQYLGAAGAAGVGYGAPAAVGAALAHRSDGVICVNIQGDGDYLMCPGSLWTAAHHKLPLLTIMHNNRAWHQETMAIQILASRRERHPERGRIGTVITDPNIDYAKIAAGFGVYSEGPITMPGELAPAIARALAVVKRGEPALLDVVMQPR